MSSDDIVIDVQGLGKRYEIYATPRDRLKQFVFPKLGRLLRPGSWAQPNPEREPRKYYKEFWALRGVSFQVGRGETLGIIGRNGSGKSTLLQILAGTMSPTTGEARVSGRIAALLELGSGFNPEFTGRENVFLNAQILGLSRQEIENRYDQIVEFADIGEFIDQPVKTYSSGMMVRLAFAVQAHIDASIVIIDEALAVGDVFFTQKCFARLRQLVDSGAAVLLVTHDMASVTQFCNKVLVLQDGVELFTGEPVAAIRRYMALQRDASAGVARRAKISAAIAAQSETVGRTDVIERPPDEAFFDLSLADIVGNGQAELLGVALCDSEGEPARIFQIGESAWFYSEYRILEDIDVPIGGITIVNEKGILVHGKNSMQHRVDAPDTCSPGSIVRFLQRIDLDLTPGEYTFVAGLASIDTYPYRNSDLMSHDELSVQSRRVVSAGQVGAFTVTLRRQGIALKHHGLADLPGECRIALVKAPVNSSSL